MGWTNENCRPSLYFEKLKIPLLILRPPNEMEPKQAHEQFELAKKWHSTYAPKYGVHELSMLVEERVGHEINEIWEIVMFFINKITVSQKN